jgi:hypothetical protein
LLTGFRTRSFPILPKSPSELLYAASSDNETFDERTARLATYKNIVTGIMQESEKLACATESSATEPIL